eukprot:gene5341-8861_t
MTQTRKTIDARLSVTCSRTTTSVALVFQMAIEFSGNYLNLEEAGSTNNRSVKENINRTSNIDNAQRMLETYTTITNQDKHEMFPEKLRPQKKTSTNNVTVVD